VSRVVLSLTLLLLLSLHVPLGLTFDTILVAPRPGQHLDKKPRPSIPSSPSASSSRLSPPLPPRRNQSRLSTLSSLGSEQEEEQDHDEEEEEEEEELMVDQEGDEEPFGHARSWLNGNWVEARDLVVDERVLSVPRRSLFQIYLSLTDRILSSTAVGYSDVAGVDAFDFERSTNGLGRRKKSTD